MKNLFTLSLVICCFFNLQGQTDLNNGLVAFYPFNGNTLDESVNGFNGINNGADLIEDCEGKNNSALFFDGIDDYVEIEHSEMLSFSGDDVFAISLWFKADANQATSGQGVSDILTKWNTNLGQPYSYTIRIRSEIANDPGQIQAARYDGDDSDCQNSTAVEGSTNLLDNLWHNVVFQKVANGNLELYVDGQIEATTLDITSCNLNSEQNILIGRRSYTNPSSARPFIGGIDNVRIYNRSLNFEEISSISNKTTSTSDLVDLDSKISIFPNPISNGKLNLNNNSDYSIESVTLYSTQGTIVQKIANLDVSSIPNGSYIVEVLLDRGAVTYKKIVILN